MPFRPAALALVVAGLLALAGCGSDEPTASPLPPVTTSAAAPSSPGPTAAPTAAPTAQEAPEGPTDTEVGGEPDTVVYGYLKDDSPTTITYDEVQFLEDACDKLEGVAADELLAAVRTCFRNTQTRTRVLPVSREVIVQPYSAEGDGQPVTLAELSGLYGTADDDTPPETEVWKISRAGADGPVVSLEQFPLGVKFP